MTTNEPGPEPGPAFDTFVSRLTLSGRLELDSALRIGAQRSSDAVAADLPVLKDVLGRPYIPGSSFKGALRSQVEALMRTIQAQHQRHDLSCESVSKDHQAGAYEGCLTNEMVKQMKNELRDDQAALERALIEKSCWTCRLFGAPWLASKVLFKDLAVDPERWFERYEIRDGVGIDRDTGRAADRFKYEYEVVPAGTRFLFKAVVENASPAQQGLFLLGLKQFELGLVQLGGARSRGLGWCTLHLDWQEGCTLLESERVLDVLLGQAEPDKLDQAWRDGRIEIFAAGLRPQTEAGHA